MTPDEMLKNAQEMIRRVRPAAEEIRLAHRERFFQGTVVIYDYTDAGQKKRDYVYFDDAGPVVHSQNFEAFLKSFADRGDRSFTLALYAFGGVLAIMVVGTVCYLAVTTGKVPEVLSASVTTILGFFFGTVATAKKHP